LERHRAHELAKAVQEFVANRLGGFRRHVAPSRPRAAGGHDQAAVLLIAQLLQGLLNLKTLIGNDAADRLPGAGEDLRQTTADSGAAEVLIDALAGAIRDSQDSNADELIGAHEVHSNAVGNKVRP